MAACRIRPLSRWLMRGGRIGIGADGAENHHQRSEFLSVGVTGYDLELGSVAAHSGMFPCFFGGKVCRLLRSARSAWITCDLVSAGIITRSM